MKAGQELPSSVPSARSHTRMEASPLMDQQAFARDLANAYRQMWREWCRQAKHKTAATFSMA